MTDYNQIIRYLTQVRQATQWFENKTVIAPGDRTEYMRKVEQAAMAQLGCGLAGVEIVEGLAAHAQMDTLLSVDAVEYEWVAQFQDRVFTIEGESNWSEVEDRLRTNMRLRTNKQEDVVLFRYPKTKTDLEKVICSTDLVRSKVFELVHAAWIQHVVAPSLDQATPLLMTKSSHSRRI